MNYKFKTLKETQEFAKKIGHCLCNRIIKCPCEVFKKTNKCICFEFNNSNTIKIKKYEEEKI